MADRLASIVIPCYRDAERALEAARRALSLPLPVGWRAEAVIVDDGSDDESTERLRGYCDARLRVICLANNIGRSGARNEGARCACGEVLLFLDSDCLPNERFIHGHIDALMCGAVASTGHVTGIGHGFWNRYQEEASRRREHRHSLGFSAAGSSQNLAVVRKHFDYVGGFDTRYRGYGFEDRDLLSRLTAVGPVAWCASARVSHRDHVKLAEVSRKMAEAGESSSSLFAGTHPDAYRELGYDLFDATRHSGWILFSPILSSLVAPLARFGDRIVAVEWIPYWARSLLVKTVSALSFLSGTLTRRRQISTR